MKILALLTLLAFNMAQADVWRNSQVPIILKFGALDMQVNLCEERQVPGCVDFVKKLNHLEREIYKLENQKYAPQMSRQQAMGFLDFKIHNTQEVIQFFLEHEKNAKDKELAELMKIMRVKIQIVLTEVIQPKKSFLVKQPDYTAYHELLFGKLNKGEVAMSDRMQKAIYEVITSPGIGTVREVVETAQATLKLYQKNGALEHDYYQDDAKEQILNYFKKGNESWDKACWICGRGHYVSAAHNMINFGLLLGGGSTERFKPPRATASVDTKPEPLPLQD